MEQEEDLKRQVKLLANLCKYLLFEKMQESQLAMAFSLLAQQRHNQLHTKGDHKRGDGSLFSDCGNDVCRMAYNTLTDRNQMSVEINSFASQQTDDFALKVEGITNDTIRAWLEPKEKIIRPENANIELQKTS